MSVKMEDMVTEVLKQFFKDRIDWERINAHGYNTVYEVAIDGQEIVANPDFLAQFPRTETVRLKLYKDVETRRAVYVGFAVENKQVWWRTDYYF